MKLCGRCKEKLDYSLFRKRTAAKDGLSAWCKSCYAQYDRDRYANGDRKRKEANKAKTVERARAYIWSILTTSQCVDCGNSDPEVLEFDHRDGVDKKNVIAEMHGYSVERIKIEIAKCDVRCSNCHKKRTIKQLGLWRGKMQ